MRYLKLLLLFILILPAHAINWQEVKNFRNDSAFVDMDSIKTIDNYYFYNIKVYNYYKNQEVIITMQARKRGGLASRINYYSPEEYESLNGDYENITSKKTTALEPMEYGSVAFECYSLVNSFVISQQMKIQI